MPGTVVTSCSLNYIAQAASLAESVRLTNPEWKVVIGIVDIPDSSLSLPELAADLLYVSELKHLGFDAEILAKRYNIVELATAAKPFLLKKLLDEMALGEILLYLDPDIRVFGPLDSIFRDEAEIEVLFTPHFLSPPPDDGRSPTERHVAKTGLYNLGFLGLKTGTQSKEFLSWWGHRLLEYCVIDFRRGLFVDQAWCNLAPIYFGKTKVSRRRSLNAAHWNLHERVFTQSDRGEWFVNSERLIFYHFSHYKPNDRDSIASHHNRFTFENRQDIISLYREYHDALSRFNYNLYISRQCGLACRPLKTRKLQATRDFLLDVLPASMVSLVARVLKTFRKLSA